MRLRLSFTRRQSSSLSEPVRFENGFKSGAFSNRYGFIGRVIFIYTLLIMENDLDAEGANMAGEEDTTETAIAAQQPQQWLNHRLVKLILARQGVPTGRVVRMWPVQAYATSNRK